MTKYPSRKHGHEFNDFERKIAAELTALGVPFQYEAEKIPFTKPAKNTYYLPDFKLPNGIFIEVKGRFETADRQKHLRIKEQHPSLDVRFVFSSSRQRISKQSKTTYEMWCLKWGFKYADKSIPLAWINENAR